jgi:hypothetical protein
MPRLKMRMRMATMEEMLPHPLLLWCHLFIAATPEEVVVEEDHVEMVSEQEAPVAHDVILADPKPELPQPHLNRMLMRDFEEIP